MLPGGFGLQLHGGYSYTNDCSRKRFFRTVEVFETYEGEKEIERFS